MDSTHGQQTSRRTRRHTAFETFTAALTAPAEVIYRLGGEQRRPRSPRDI
jgi:hypothetical protein